MANEPSGGDEKAAWYAGLAGRSAPTSGNYASYRRGQAVRHMTVSDGPSVATGDNPPGAGGGGLLVALFLFPVLFPFGVATVGLWQMLTALNWHPAAKVIACTTLLICLFKISHRALNVFPRSLAVVVMVAYFELAYWVYFYLTAEIEKTSAIIFITIVGYIGALVGGAATGASAKKVHVGVVALAPILVAAFIAVVVHPYWGPRIFPNAKTNHIEVLDRFAQYRRGDILVVTCPTLIFSLQDTFLLAPKVGTEVIFTGVNRYEKFRPDFPRADSGVLVALKDGTSNQSGKMSPFCLAWKRSAPPDWGSALNSHQPIRIHHRRHS